MITFIEWNKRVSIPTTVIGIIGRMIEDHRGNVASVQEMSICPISFIRGRIIEIAPTQPTALLKDFFSSSFII